MFRMTAMDHIVLNVRNMDRVLDFYQTVLGLPAERLAEFRRGEVPFPSVRISADTVIDLFPVADSDDATPERSDLNHFCLVLGEDDMPRLMAPFGGARRRHRGRAGHPLGGARQRHVDLFLGPRGAAHRGALLQRWIDRPAACQASCPEPMIPPHGPHDACRWPDLA